MDSTPPSNTSPVSEGLVLPQNARQPKRPRVSEENRRRATRACEGCRRLKEKCEGGFPCSRCNRTGRKCEFKNVASTDQAKRSMQLDDDEKDERTKYLEQIARHFLGDVSLALPNLRRISEKIDSHPRVESEASHVDLNDLEDLKLEDETFSVKGLSQNTAHYSGEFSHWTFGERVQKQVDERLDQNAAKDLKGKMQVIEYFRATQLQTPASTVFAVLQCLPPRPVADFLLQIYFKYAQTNSFYVEESWLREKIEILHESPAEISSSDAAWICAVLMVLAIGSQFVHMSAPPIEDTADGSDSPDEQEVGVALYHMASKLIPDVITIASLESVQACLLLAHYALPLDAHGLAYTYLGLSIKMAIQNGMHRKYTGKFFDALTVETRNRLWWNAYTLEKRICVLHGRPLSVSPNDVDADLPVDLPEFRSATRFSTFANMNALIYLTVRLGDISHAITLLRKCPKRLQPNYFERIFEIRQQLQTWWSTLPSSLTCKDLSTTSALFRHNIHLTLCFHLNEIYMGRPFIFSDSKFSSPLGNKAASGTSPSGASRNHGRAALVSDAVTAALEIIKLCRLLQDNCGLARASYIEFSSLRAALLAILAQSINESNERLRTSLVTGMKLIKSMAVGIVSAKSEVSIIEAIETAIKRLDMRGDEPKNEEASESGYDRFKSWAMLWKNGQEAGGTNFGPALPAQMVNFQGNVETFQAGMDVTSYGNIPLNSPGIGSQLSGFGFSDIFDPSLTQGDATLQNDQWQEEMGDLQDFGFDMEPGGWG